MPSAVSPGDLDPFAPLASRFHAALGAARGALGGHAGLLPAGRLARLDALIADFEKRRVRIAVYGEVKAGKSTLVNAMAGASLSPSSFGPLTSVPIRITYGTATSWHAAGTSFASAEALAEAMRADTELEEVTVTTDLDLLRLGGQLDLVDTPGVGSDDRFDAVSARVLAKLDAVVIVVRYPGLFTRFTRHLMQQLEGEIGKLFVVWNLDAACAELPPEELERQVDSLRRHVAGAHDLYTVDARKAFAARQAGDRAALEASGLAAFLDGLHQFARSSRRGAIALRESAKRVQKWLQQADDALQKRRTVLQASVAETQRLLATIEAEAAAESTAARETFAGFQKQLADIVATDAADATKSYQVYGKQLGKARRRWMRGGDAALLGAAVQEASEAYANSVDSALTRTTDAMHAAASAFGTAITAAPRERMVPSVENLGPEDRLVRAGEGRLRGTRRRLWRRWYLPGFERLLGQEIPAELAARADWRTTAQRAAEGAGQATLDARLAEIERRARRAAEVLAQERHLAEEQSELAAIERDAPVVGESRGEIADLAAAARQTVS